MYILEAEHKTLVGTSGTQSYPRTKITYNIHSLSFKFMDK